jgi:hypothetical protein
MIIISIRQVGRAVMPIGNNNCIKLLQDVTAFEFQQCCYKYTSVA